MLLQVALLWLLDVSDIDLCQIRLQIYVSANLSHIALLMIWSHSEVPRTMIMCWQLNVSATSGCTSFILLHF